MLDIIRGLGAESFTIPLLFVACLYALKALGIQDSSSNSSPECNAMILGMEFL